MKEVIYQFRCDQCKRRLGRGTILTEGITKKIIKSEKEIELHFCNEMCEENHGNKKL